jgi:hypothetical protein
VNLDLASTLAEFLARKAARRDVQGVPRPLVSSVCVFMNT